MIAGLSCDDYGIDHGCDENCPVLIAGDCQIYKSVEDYLGEEQDGGAE